MKNFLKIAFICIFMGCSLTSCFIGGRGISDVEAMEDGREKDSIMYFTLYAVTYGTVLHPIDTIHLSKKATWNNDESITVLPDDLVKIIDLKKADTGKKQHYSKEPIYGDIMQLSISRDGVEINKAWLNTELLVSKLAPDKWTRNFYKYRILLIHLSLVLLVIFLIFQISLRIYNKYCKKKGITPKTIGTISWMVYFGCAILIGVFATIMTFWPEMAQKIYYNPNMFAHWSEYPLLFKLLPIVIIIMAISAVTMLFEMKARMRTNWFILPYLGLLFTGLLVVLFTVAFAHVIYVVIIGICIIFVLSSVGDITKPSKESIQAAKDKKFYDNIKKRDGKMD